MLLICFRPSFRMLPNRCPSSCCGMVRQSIHYFVLWRAAVEVPIAIIIGQGVRRKEVAEEHCGSRGGDCQGEDHGHRRGRCTYLTPI